jgi:hypothetical protein
VVVVLAIGKLSRAKLSDPWRSGIFPDEALIFIMGPKTSKAVRRGCEKISLTFG